MKKFEVVTSYTSHDIHLVEAESTEDAKKLVESGEFYEEVALKGDYAYLISVETDSTKSYENEQIVSVEEVT